jgi:hypothetical protein
MESNGAYNAPYARCSFSPGVGCVPRTIIRCCAAPPLYVNRPITAQIRCPAFDYIQTAIKNVKEVEGNLVNNASKELARLISETIARSEPIIADLVRNGSVKIVPAYYDLMSGEVEFL